ncbi:hypothetical protein [Ligilactobacillus salivarius]|uniref:Uncharacterized protein n=2 Tax=Ligilactobacillus salivarius TaxID=1624 RepID=A0A2A2X656_9LACO|nr:hypothetical protein [Ligilactobacillus salivarius]ATP38491.1 hypothetical protein CR531_10140 [Ligilactobacillus salivarius]EEJ73536.1 hypothetical protein HMPREF0545_1575 [Ligilactobacillus salivarius DSM 20555 = ATCC 11741]KRM68418.1 hypothetical protein FC55_GL001127 [Ligilactobacillus salivarius DSM 20555 = ATCC 11741]MBE7387234.1 hypothetical protein [Ligilactobacillus salivarius]MBE7391628.1 hypothetical protein [Ligilactobacillus salivarius]
MEIIDEFSTTSDLGGVLIGNTYNGKRIINIRVNDSVYILPKIDKNFEMFVDESEGEDNE